MRSSKQRTRVIWSAIALTLATTLVPVVSASAQSRIDAPERPTPRLEIPGEYPGLGRGPQSPPTTPMARIWIARIGVKMNIFKGVTDPVFKKGVGYWPGTGLPGVVGNMVLGGHRTTGPRPFYYIERIKIGDPIVINYKGKLYTYKVIRTRIIKPTDTWILAQDVTKPMLTIFACHPRGSYKQRYVVTAVLNA